MSRNASRQTRNQQQSPNASQGGASFNGRRESQASQAYSPAGAISRTPSADRKLLRTLTVSPNNPYDGANDLDDDDESDIHPPPVFNKKVPVRQKTKTPVRDTPSRQTADHITPQRTPDEITLSRQSNRNTTQEITLDRQTVQTTGTAKSPTATYQTSNRMPSVQDSIHISEPARASTKPARQVVDLPKLTSNNNSKAENVNISENISESGQRSAKPARQVVDIPKLKTDNDSKTEDWQSNKTVAESNNYMLKYEVASDVTFAVGDSREEIRAHKYMLMARSPVLFKSLVRHLGNTDIKIGVPDIRPDTFREMLQYIYTDEFDIHADNVSGVLFAAKKFQLKGLSDLCFQYLASELSDATVAKVMEQAHIYNETVLYERCLRFIYANGNDILRNPNVGQLCVECLEKALKSDDLRASEEAVFEGSVIWANAECRRQKLQPTDEARREVLGKLLYLIRFPLMGVTYFTQKVSLGEMLSHDEKLSIFQYYHGEEQQLPQRFSRTERKQIPKDTMFMENNNQSHENYTTNDRQSPLASKSKAKRIQRFRSTDGQWKQNGPPDAISFTTSEPIVLYGLELFGSCKGTETYAVKLYVYDDISRQEIRQSEESIYTSPKKDTYDVFFTRPLRVPAKRVFTAVVAMKGSPTHKGVDGETIRTADGVTFEFSDSNRSSNGSDVTVGQIAGLLFNKTQ